MDILAEGTDILAEGTDILAEGTDIRAEGTDILAEGTDILAEGIFIDTRGVYPLISGNEGNGCSCIFDKFSAGIPPDTFAPDSPTLGTAEDKEALVTVVGANSVFAD